MFIPFQFASLYDGQVLVWSDRPLNLGTDFLFGSSVHIPIFKKFFPRVKIIDQSKSTVLLLMTHIVTVPKLFFVFFFFF